MARIGWGLTGAGDLLFETFHVMEEIAQDHSLSCYLSDAGERVVHIYGLWERLKKICPGSYYREIISESEQGAASPLSGRLQRGRYKALIVSPASANTVAKASIGIADTLVTNAISQARKGGVPTLIVPTDQEGKRISKLPYLIDRGICKKQLGTSHEKCQILDICPYGAIIEALGLPKIDLTKCEGCGICLENCPYDAISFGQEIEANVEEIDLKNVQRLREHKSFTVVKSPERIPNALKEVKNAKSKSSTRYR
ncbi:hypothetical protein AKJ43_02070 [candidate division MSBL1 archaeon SCGC-AAA261D19]|uniref:4Fe-4S ferredoxin-type domain-containing protein n=1 Tax=candidate division MSBL1 archaeon SCGC-AAA261D19 TaxID=1698273 RepID=A0A133V7A5_9EURY|nr:hypothetical protein AKJ43_02070 [candidate division MSBL1 archaeon SCGC-AAA261D19]